MVKIKLLTETAQLPTKGSVNSAGYDLYADFFPENGEFLTIGPHETVKVPTGISIEIPNGWFGGVFPRSGISSKRGLRPANCVGVIDADYRGEIFVALHNDSDRNQYVTPGERIAQLIMIPFGNIEWQVSEELSSTDRGSSGFGSTGKI